MTNAHISVIIPYYNAGKFIEGALASIRRQAYEPLEIILVDDGSTDDIATRITTLGSDILFLRQANKGPAAARNHGLSHATGELIAFLDADDLWPDGKLNAQVARLQGDPALGIVTGRVQYKGLAGARELLAAEKEGRVSSIHLGASLMRRSVFDVVGVFNETMRFFEDKDWYIRVRENQIRVALLKETTLIYQLHADNMTNNIALDQTRDRQFLEMLKRSIDRRKVSGNGEVAPLPAWPVFYDSVGLSAEPIATERYFAEMYAAFECATAHTPVADRYFQIGPETIRTRIAGTPLVGTLTRALAHLETVPCANPSLTVFCVDNASTEGLFPEPLPSFTAHRFVEGNGIRSAYRVNTDVLNMYDRRQRLGIYWVRDAGRIPYWEYSIPLRELFHWWTASLPLQLVHAAAVGTEKGGVLLSGKPGSGKSTSALACMESRLNYLGDDYVLVATHPQPCVYSLYNAGKLNTDSLGMVPHLAGKVSNPERQGDEKALMFMHEHYAHKLSKGLPIRAIFLPRVTQERDTRLRPATKVESMIAVTPTTIMELKGNSQAALDKIRILVDSVPHYWLELGSDLKQIPEVIAGYLENLDV